MAVRIQQVLVTTCMSCLCHPFRLWCRLRYNYRDALQACFIEGLNLELCIYLDVVPVSDSCPNANRLRALTLFRIVERVRNVSEQALNCHTLALRGCSTIWKMDCLQSTVQTVQSTSGPAQQNNFKWPSSVMLLFQQLCTFCKLNLTKATLSLDVSHLMGWLCWRVM